MITNLVIFIWLKKTGDLSLRYEILLIFAIHLDRTLHSYLWSNTTANKEYVIILLLSSITEIVK